MPECREKMEDNNDDDDEDEYATTMGSDTDRGERRRRFVQRWKRPKQLPASKKEVFNAFDLATTNQLLRYRFTYLAIMWPTLTRLVKTTMNLVTHPVMCPRF